MRNPVRIALVVAALTTLGVGVWIGKHVAAYRPIPPIPEELRLAEVVAPVAGENGWTPINNAVRSGGVGSRSAPAWDDFGFQGVRGDYAEPQREARRTLLTQVMNDESAAPHFELARTLLARERFVDLQDPDDELNDCFVVAQIFGAAAALVEANILAPGGRRDAEEAVHLLNLAGDFLRNSQDGVRMLAADLTRQQTLRALRHAIEHLTDVLASGEPVDTSTVGASVERAIQADDAIRVSVDTFIASEVRKLHSSYQALVSDGNWAARFHFNPGETLDVLDTHALQVREYFRRGQTGPEPVLPTYQGRIHFWTPNAVGKALVDIERGTGLARIARKLLEGARRSDELRAEVRQALREFRASANAR